MIAVERLTKQTHFAGIGPDEAEQHSDRRRLARAVWAKEAVDARRRNQQVQIVHRELGTKTASQPPRLDQIVICLRHLTVNATGRDLLT